MVSRAVQLTAGELAVLEACLPDGKPPREIRSADVHRKLEALGLMNRRVGPAPNGDTADFWSTNENGAWALRVARQCASKEEI